MLLHRNKPVFLIEYTRKTHFYVKNIQSEVHGMRYVAKAL